MPRGAQALHRRAPQKSDAPVTRYGTCSESVEASKRSLVVGVGRARDLLDPLHDVRGVRDRHGRRLARGEALVEIGDEVAQALIALHLLAHELHTPIGNVRSAAGSSRRTH